MRHGAIVVLVGLLALAVILFIFPPGETFDAPTSGVRSVDDRPAQPASHRMGPLDLGSFESRDVYTWIERETTIEGQTSITESASN